MKKCVISLENPKLRVFLFLCGEIIKLSPYPYTYKWNCCTIPRILQNKVPLNLFGSGRVSKHNHAFKRCSLPGLLEQKSNLGSYIQLLLERTEALGLEMALFVKSSSCERIGDARELSNMSFSVVAKPRLCVWLRPPGECLFYKPYARLEADMFGQKCTSLNLLTLLYDPQLVWRTWLSYWSIGCWLHLFRVVVKAGGCCFQAVQPHNMLWKICRMLPGVPKFISPVYTLHIFHLLFIFHDTYTAPQRCASIGEQYRFYVDCCTHCRHCFVQLWSYPACLIPMAEWMGCPWSRITSSHAHIQSLMQKGLGCPPFIYPHPNTLGI